MKWIAGIIFAPLLVAVLGLLALGFASLVFPWKGMFVFVPGQAFSVFPMGAGLGRFAFAHLFRAVNASAVLSSAFMFSCFNMKPAAATIVGLSYFFVKRVMAGILCYKRFDIWFSSHHYR